MANINILFNGRKDAIEFVDDYGSMVLEAKRKPAEDTSKSKRLKILAPKQMLQRLPIALAQLKAGNTYENLLNEIKQIIYFLHRAKEITKKLNSNIKNSIKV